MKWFYILIVFFSLTVDAQILNHKKEFTRQDSLRGSNNEFRNWWNVLHYDIQVEPDFEKRFIKGKNAIQFEITENLSREIIQIDLQEPMNLGKVKLDDVEINSQNIRREGNVYFIKTDKKWKTNSKHILELEFSGNPRVAVQPPWDGGWIFEQDAKGRPFMSVACQGLGASVWFPNKDYQGDEPDLGAKLSMIVPEDLIAIGNGKLVDMNQIDDKLEFVWEVKNPINNYNIIPYIGHYTEIKDAYKGEKGELSLNYWVLDYNREKAEKQFEQTKPMLKSFEKWFGPYPFYEGGYKLVEAPHLGMEHQSAIAYGNHFENGYLGRDLSSSGWGLKWDFILVHESGHEWFGNNITTQDVADMWVHESFTAYSETLHTQELFGIEAGNDYVIGTRMNILNDIPMIGIYGVNQEGSGDIYYKGANMIHTFRHLLEDDDLFLRILRGLNEKFYHQTVTTKQIEDYMSQMSKIDLTEFFNQYLRTTLVPTLEYKIKGDEITYRWTNIVEKFDMPVKVANSDQWLFPTADWKTEKLKSGTEKGFKIDRNFYVKSVKKD
ncbi:M1 family metallopeptidase [Moheibacter lacus]|uniref:M1 family metallopeptidase n=1 Tax=Moheibacter lacus TaxID=2745851 RepID=A0A838ZU34_9FLAO|nr:M1 family metallopeptidase [Moheibacter lacus]MBA5630472.1 M1 family metallopeptidase [Moheibacter lacus]